MTTKAMQLAIELSNKDFDNGGFGYTLGFGSFMEKVAEFHQVYGCPINTSSKPSVAAMGDRVYLRLDLIQEEFDELKVAVANTDVVEVADALGDLIYVICGFAIEAGISLDNVVDEIHASNLTKLGADGIPMVRDDGKILKGPNYVKPDIAAVLGLRQ